MLNEHQLARSVIVVRWSVRPQIALIHCGEGAERLPCLPHFGDKWIDQGGKEGEKKKRRNDCTGFSSEIGTKLREWAVGQAGGSCNSQAALSLNYSKTRYLTLCLLGDTSRLGH